MIKRESHCGFIRPLADSDEAELTAIPRKQRAEVRKSLAGELTVETGTSAADRAAHYAVYAQSVRNLGTPVFPKALFRGLLDAFADDIEIAAPKSNAIVNSLDSFLIFSEFDFGAMLFEIFQNTMQ